MAEGSRRLELGEVLLSVERSVGTRRALATAGRAVAAGCAVTTASTALSAGATATFPALAVTSTAASRAGSLVTLSVGLHSLELEADVENDGLATGTLILTGSLGLGGTSAQVVLQLGGSNSGQTSELLLLVHSAHRSRGAGELSQSLSGLLTLLVEVIQSEGDRLGLGRGDLLHSGDLLGLTLDDDAVNGTLDGGLGVLLGVNSVLGRVASAESATTTAGDLSSATGATSTVEFTSRGALLALGFLVAVLLLAVSLSVSVAASVIFLGGLLLTISGRSGSLGRLSICSTLQYVI